MRGRAVNSGVEQSSLQIQSGHLDGKCLVARETDCEIVVALLQSLLELVTEPQVQGQLRADAEIIMLVAGVVVDVEVVRRADGNVAARREREQESGKRVLERDTAERVRAYGEYRAEVEASARLAAREELHPNDTVIEAAFERVAAEQLRDAGANIMPIECCVLRITVPEGVEIDCPVTGNGKTRELLVWDGAQEA